MKNLKNIILAMVAIVALASCESDTGSEVLENADTAGAIIQISGSGKILGSPSIPTDLENSPITLSEYALTLNVDDSSSDLSSVDHFEIVKQFNGGSEVSEASFTTFPYTLSYTTFEEFLSGTSATEPNLRIGDVFSYTVKVHKTDGNVYSYSNQTFDVTINCSADLSGTYTMTNTVCASSETVTITQNANGSWNLSTADGGLLQFCSSNSSLVNVGDITIVCGEVLPSDDVVYCPGYGIGCITGGSWDQESGILNLTHINDFFTWADAAYESTYVRD